MTAAAQVRPGTEDDQQDQIAALQPALADGLVERDGHGGGGGVAVLVEIDEDLLRLDAETLADGVDDPAIGLVRNDAV